MKKTNLALLGLLSLVPLTSFANVLWRGDYQTGNLSQWSEIETVNPDRLQVVTAPPGAPGYAMQVLVKQGDYIFYGTRAEVDYEVSDPVGSERYFRWSTYWPAGYPSVDAWQLFTQWHQYSGGASPPVQFYVRGEKIIFSLNSVGGVENVLWTTPLVRGQWHQFIFHVKWATDPSAGFVELYYDGQKVLPATPAVTMFPGSFNYMKQGIYRDSSITVDTSLFHTGMMVATDLADVIPPPPPASEADAGTPAQDPGNPAPSGSNVSSAGTGGGTLATTPPPALPVLATDGGTPGSSQAAAAVGTVRTGCSSVGGGPGLVILPVLAYLVFWRRRYGWRT